jgi:hypothetical protein
VLIPARDERFVSNSVFNRL